MTSDCNLVIWLHREGAGPPINKGNFHMAKFSNDELLAKYLDLVLDENSNDAELGCVLIELEARGL